MPQSEQEKFLNNLDAPEQVDIMDQPLVPDEQFQQQTQQEPQAPTMQQQDVNPEDAPESVKDRRHRRLEDKLRIERESNIAMAARLEALSEAQKVRTTSEADNYLKSVERIYGTNSPEAVEATSLLQTALKSVEERATQNALEAFRKEQADAAAEARKNDRLLDDMIDDIEDEYNVDLTSPKQAEIRKGFFKMLERLSPKDKDGNILDYADHIAVWEDYASKATAPKQQSRAKQLSSRSMTAGGGTPGGTKPVDDATARYLHENGLI